MTFAARRDGSAVTARSGCAAEPGLIAMRRRAAEPGPTRPTSHASVARLSTNAEPRSGAALSEAARANIEAFLRRAPYLHDYELGDLDPREAAHTTWFADDPVRAVALLYHGLVTPTLIALVAAGNDAGRMRALLASVARGLPRRYIAHLSAGLIESLAPARAESLGDHWKMGLTAAAAPASTAAGEAIAQLMPGDADDVVRFYAESYPDSYFEPVNLVRGPYLAIRDRHGIAAIAGVHAYSPATRVASLGNIATRPDARGRGYARRVTAALCDRLRAEIDVIGLNVRADNAAAIACYRAVGFERLGEYGEWRLTRDDA